MLLCLILLSACSTVKPIEKAVVIEPVLIHQQVPKWMIKLINTPQLNGAKYSDLVDLAIRYDSSLMQCNAQLSAISELNNKTPVNR